MTAVLTKTFDLLELLNAAAGQPMMLKDMVEKTGINQPTCARLLQNLIDLGYVSKFGPRHGYTLGPMARALGQGQPWWSRWKQIAQPLIKQLAIDLGEHVLLAILHRGKRHIVSSHSANPIISVRSGDSFDDDLYTTVTGRLLLAHAERGEVDGYVSRQGLPGKAWANLRSRKQLDEALECIREHPMEPVTHAGPVLSIMAVPVIRDDKVIAALGIAAPTSTFVEKHQKQAVKQAFMTATSLAEKLS